jgi:hypothetical protein
MKKQYKYKTPKNKLQDDQRIDPFNSELQKEQDIKIQSKIENEMPKESLINKIKNDSAAIFFIIIAIFAISVFSYVLFISSIDMREPVIIKLKSVDNYSNFVTDECGYIYSPINPPLTNAITTDEKQKSTFIPIILNESDVYSADIVSSKLTRSSMFVGNYITNFKLIDHSKYIKKC